MPFQREPAGHRIPPITSRSTGSSSGFQPVGGYVGHPFGGSSPQKVLSRNAEVLVDDVADPLVVAAYDVRDDRVVSLAAGITVIGSPTVGFARANPSDVQREFMD